MIHRRSILLCNMKYYTVILTSRARIRQTEIHTAEPLVPEPSASEVELTIEKLKVTNYQVLIKYQQN